MQKRNINTAIIRNIKVSLSDKTIRIRKNLHLEMTCGVAQRSVFGPTLWNLYYDRVLKILKHRDISIIRCAKYLALVISRKNKEKLKNRAH